MQLFCSSNNRRRRVVAALVFNFCCCGGYHVIFKEIIVGEAKTVVTSLLHGTASLFTVPNILERFETACANGEECLFLLDEMNRLANLLSSSKNVLG